MKNDKIILGTVQMGLNYGINNLNGKISEQDSNNILYNAYESGIYYLDTAELYGNAHNIIGEFHNKNQNIRFKVNTKFPHQFDTNNVENKIYDYLSILNIESIETLMFHSFESYKSNYKSLNILNKLKSDGLIKHIGVSVYSNAELEILINDDLLEVIQLPFNLLDNYSIRGNLIKKLKAKGKIIHTRSAFLQGLFFKKLSDKFYIVQALKPYLNKIKKITYEYKCSIEELALSYCINQNNVNNVIIGVDSISQLKSNISASKYKLSKEVKNRVNNIVVENLNLLNPSLWN